jgi:AraC-like DNA-binding protein
METNGSRSGEIFDISRLRPERRTDVWTDALYEKYYPLDVDFPGPLFAVGRLAIKDLMDIRVGRVQSDPFIVHRRRGHLSQRSGDYYLVLIPARQPLRLRQRGQEALVAPGDAVVVGTTETYCYEQRTRNDILTLRIPGPLLRERIGDIDDCTARALPIAQASVALFVDFARSLSLHGSELESYDAKISLRGLLDLLAIATFAPEKAGASGETSVRIAHRRRALKLIDAKLADHALTPSLVARTLGLSGRYLQQIFAGHGQNLSSIIRARRIDEAKRLLWSAGSRHHSISSIAYAVGFADPGHFSRAFLAETGTSPRDFRSQSQSASDPRQ